MSRWVALLRGINVGGNNLIKMTALKECFEAMGFEDVATYIQSGNVLFDAPGKDAELTRRVEQALSKSFAYRASVVLRTKKQMQEIVRGAPRGFGTLPEKFRYDVVFLKAPLTVAEAMEKVPVTEGVDAKYPGKGVVYFSRLVAKATQSRLSKVVSMPIYQSMTIRNWNTTTKLLALLEV